MFRDEFKEPMSSDRNFDKDNTTGQNTDDSVIANTPVRVLSANSIIGDKVENFQGEHLGTIKDLMLDINRGCIDYVVLEFGGFIGIGTKLFAVPHRALALDPARKVFLINKTKEELKKAPGFDKDHWPETNSRHFDEVNNFWDYTIPRDNSDTGISS